MPFVNSHGCRIYYRLEGSASKPLLVLVHSLGMDHGMWELQMPSVLRNFRVLRLDLRGHGASDAPAGGYTIAQLAEDVLAAADAVGHERFSYCGLSLGAMIGQWLGAKTSRIERLVLANTSARMADTGFIDDLRKAILEQGMGAIIGPAMEFSFTARTFASANATAESIRQVVLATDPAGYAGCCAALRDMDHRQLVTGIRVPTLVIGSDQDVATPWKEHGEVLAASIPQARTVLLNAAHLSNIERPSGFNAALVEFLTGDAAPAEPWEAGMAIRRAVLGDAHVDSAMANASSLTRNFQDLITRYAWGTIWTRPGLDLRTRRLLVLAMTASLGRWEEFRLHVRTGFASELEVPDLEEVLLQVAIYAGVPAANSGFKIAAEEAKQA